MHEISCFKVGEEKSLRHACFTKFYFAAQRDNFIHDSVATSNSGDVFQQKQNRIWQM